MSTFRTPVGPQPSRVYWRRRLAVLVGLVVVVLIVILIVLRPGPGKPTAVPTNTPTNTALATAPACKPANVQVVAVTDALSYAAGVDPQLSLTITNTGSSPCSFKDGSDVQVYKITSGTDQIWSSKDCQSAPQPNTSILVPGTAISSPPISWNRTRSNAAACSATNAPEVVAGGASYHLTVIVNGISSSTANSPQFVLK